jgi:hypothetical protein
VKIAYIAGPYRAPSEFYVLENIRQAERVALKYRQLGYAVICPHENTAFLGGACPDETWLNGDLEFVKRSDVIVMLPNWQQSVGSRQEHVVATKLGKQIIYEQANVPAQA